MSQVTHRLQSYLRYKVAYEFPTEEALKKYLNEHPGADKSLHYVAQPKPTTRVPEETTPTLKTYEESKELFRQESYKNWENSLSESERKSFYEYTGDSYRDINLVLRRDLEHTKEDDFAGVHIYNMKNALERYHLPESIYVYRGMDFRALPKSVLKDVVKGNLSPEDIQWSDKGFVSTSLRPAEGFKHKKIQCRIALPKGTHGAYIEGLSQHKSEEEFLIDTGHTFQLKKVSFDEGKFFVEAEVIPKGKETNKPPIKPTKLEELWDYLKYVFSD